MVAGLEVKPLSSLPDDIRVLLDAARAEGHDLVQRLVDEWNDGSNLFDDLGEVALEVRIGTRLVAVGGLNRDPYLNDPSVGRIRHVYVAADLRGQGVGRVLVTALIDHARGRFARVRVRTVIRGGSRFYAALGFEETPEEPDATHQIRLQ